MNQIVMTVKRRMTQIMTVITIFEETDHHDRGSKRWLASTVRTLSYVACKTLFMGNFLR